MWSDLKSCVNTESIQSVLEKPVKACGGETSLIRTVCMEISL